MSEYQYYEFLAIERPLGAREMKELRSYSSRATITSTRFVNHYEWGDFKGNPTAWIEKYFDAFLYLANWGTHELMLRLPRRALDIKLARQYFVGDAASVRVKGEQLILEFHSESEEHSDDDWNDDGRGWLSSLIPLRHDLKSGDHRVLYLAWLLFGGLGELEDDALEPPVPPGMGQLSAPLQSFIDFLRIDKDLIEIAAERSGASRGGLSKKELTGYIARLSEAEKTALLLRMADGEEVQLRAELLRRFRGRGGRLASAVPSRTFGEIRAAAAELAEARHRRAAERATRDEARRNRQEAEARDKYLKQLAKREPATWHRVAAHVATKKASEYDEAVQLLVDLRDLAIRKNRTAESQARIDRICVENSKKPSFIQRLQRAGLITDRG